MPKVSVIIPVFGVEQYIERCARSLFEQTLEDIEYIFINDCTPDASIDILKAMLTEYPNRVEQVKIVNMEQNSGQAAVRKRGVELATGEYIIHCDSDDFVDRDMYGKLYDNAVSNGNLIVSCDYIEEFSEEKYYRKSKLSGISSLVEDILMLPAGGALWIRLVHSSLVHNPSLHYPENNVAEDLALLSQYALLSSSDGYVPEPLYHYCRRSSSVISNHTVDGTLNNNRQHKENLDLAISAIVHSGMYNKYSEQILHHKLNVKNTYLKLVGKIDAMKLWRQTYPEINNQVMFSRIFTVKEKLLFVAAYLGIYPLYRKLFK